MKKLFTILAAFGLASFTSEAQLNLSGTVGSAGKPLEAATINLLKASDSSIVKMTMSMKMGDFKLSNIETGKYLVYVTAVGYQKYYSPAFELGNQSHKLPAIDLAAANKALAGVTVTSKKAFIEQRPGKTVINVEASATSAGLNALELLEKSPGVSVDKDGVISLKGKQGVMVLVDGKPTYMSGADLAGLLKSMQSNNIDQVEIMTNPPAKYDAAGNSGIINIKTKKSNTRGLNGNLSSSYTQGIYGRTNQSLNVNYRNKNINIFGGLGYSYYEGFNNLKLDRVFYGADKSIVGLSDQVSRPHFYGNNYSAKAGVDYTLSKKDVIGVMVNSFFSNGGENPYSTSYVRDARSNIIYSLKSENDNTFKFSNVSTNFNYKHTFDSIGREISADLDYIYYNKNSNTLLSTATFDKHGAKNANDVNLKGVIPSGIDIYSFKVDYVHPLSKTLKLEAGGKSSFVNSNNQVEYTRNNGTGWYADNRSNHFIYKENLNAAYVSISKNWKKWNMQVGLRAENTIAKGKQVINDSSFDRNYTNLFPNIGVGFDASKKHQFNFSYSRRIDRPDYDDLNPFVFFLDSLTYGQGNPYLQPQITNKFEGSYTFNRFLTTTLNYEETDDVITQLLKQDTEKKVTYQTRDNVNKMKQIALTVMVNKPITKWWNTNVYLNVFNNHYTGMYVADPIDIQFTSFAGNMTNSFTFPKGWGAEVSGFYRSKVADGLLIANQMYMVNGGVTKQVLKKKGTLKLSIRDIFLTQKFSGYARYSDVNVNLTSTRDSRQVSLSFNYRFGKTSIPPARKKSGGAGDEQSRVKAGGNN
jgi:iron complex outermembrane recepter protein